jgi:hypothetical protein
MELTYDWRSFQSVFYPQKRTMNIHLETQDSGVIFAVVENGTVISAYDENEDLSDFIGVGVETLKVSHPHRKVVSLERENVDQWIQSAVAKPHLYEQIDFFRKSAAPQLESKVRNSLERKACTAEKHFLLNGLMGAWSKVFPSAFGKSAARLFAIVSGSGFERKVRPSVQRIPRSRAGYFNSISRRKTRSFL